MKKLSTLLFVGLFSLTTMSGCTVTGSDIGTAAGAAAGAGIGYAATDSGWGAAAGAGLGSLAGKAIGDSVDKENAAKNVD